MNKKSAILFFSVLFLLSLSVLYVFGDLSSFTLTKFGDGYEKPNWISDKAPVTINLTATADAAEDTEGISSISFTIDTANVTWDFVALDGTTEKLDIEGGLTNITYAADGSAWARWNCTNSSLSAITCESLDSNVNLTSRYTNNGSLIVPINVTVTGSAREEADVNFTIYTNQSGGHNNTVNMSLYIDSQYPRLYEVNISDGNTTYANSTWGTQYYLNGPITIDALIEDAQLEGAVVLGYNCNITNGSFDEEGQGGWYAENALTVTNQDAGTIRTTLNQKGNVTSSSINCYALYSSGIYSSDLGVSGANETFTFAFLVNDTFNHRIMLNATGHSDFDPFNITLDDGEYLPTIERVNVTQTRIGTSDGDTSVIKTLDDHTSGALDGGNDYLAANIVTFDVELKGGNKPDQVYIVWNDTGAATTTFGPAVIGATGPVFQYITNLDETAALTLNNNSDALVNSAITSNTTTTVYSQTLNLAGNSSNNFAFWVYANNTGNNYTRIAGPYMFQVDGAVPSITMTPPTDLVINPRASITYKCTMTDGASGNNKIMWMLKKPGEVVYTKKQGYVDVVSGSDSITFTGDDTNLAGEYNVKCLAIDNVGNEKEYISSSSEIFSVHYSTAYGEGAAEGGAVADIDLSTQEEVTITEKQGVISTFTLDGTTVHTIKIKTVDEVAGTVTIIIESDPITITLKIGEMKEVDVDADGANDISVTLNGITDGVADLTTKRLTPLPTEKPTEEVPPTEKPAEEITPTEAASKTWLWILIIVIIVVIGVGYWFMKRK